MPDQKITSLTEQTANAVDAADDYLAISDDTASTKRISVGNLFDCITIDRSNNKVGIGTDAPDKTLHVKGVGHQEIKAESTNSNGYVSISSRSTEDYDSYLSFKAADSVKGQIMYDHNTDEDLQKMVFTVGDNAVNAMTILGTGNVGIGVADPDQKLEIHGNLKLNSSAGDEARYLFTVGNASQDSVMSMYNRDAVQKISLDTGGNSYFIGGNVGIGTTSPAQPLHVITPGTTDDGIVKIGGDGVSTGLELQYDQSGSTTAKIISNPTADVSAAKMNICVDGDSNPVQLVLKGDGFIGIGTDNPTSPLHIDQSDGSGATTVLKLDQGDVDDSFIDFIGTSASGSTGSISSSEDEDSNKVGAIKVEINGSDKWIRFYDDAI